MNTTISERLFTIIQANEQHVNEINGPEVLTLGGLADAVHRRNGHISVELKRMRDSGRVVKVLRHIPSQTRRQYVYVSSRVFCTALKPGESIKPKHLEAFVMRLNDRLNALESRLNADNNKQS